MVGQKISVMQGILMNFRKRKGCEKDVKEINDSDSSSHGTAYSNPDFGRAVCNNDSFKEVRIK